MVHVGKILGRGALGHSLLPLQLLGQERAEMLRRLVNVCFLIHQSFPSLV